MTRFHLAGLPHSEILGSKPACGSPRLIAADRVLHRPRAPRHPPYALSSLTIRNYGHVSPSAFATLPDRLSKNRWIRSGSLLPIEKIGRKHSESVTGGEYRDRTGDLLVANQALSQLS